MSSWRTYATKIFDYFSRKFVLSSLSLVGGFYLVLHDKPVLEFSALVAAVLAFYNGANVVETVAAMRNNVLSTKMMKHSTPTKIEVEAELS